MKALMIDFKGKKVVIVGGGEIALRKARVLAEEKADLTFIAPEFTDGIVTLSREFGYSLLKRKAKSTDFYEAFLVILATNDRETNQKFASFLQPQQLVCVVDEATEGNVVFPATITRGDLQIAVTTNGASPKLTKNLKKDLETQFDESWEAYIAFLAECRQIIKKLSISTADRNQLLEDLLNHKYRTDNQIRAKKLSELHQMTFTRN